MNPEFGSFLRFKRAALDPVGAGFPPGPRRRTPGLRREEVAQLAGVSVTWYTWLEQNRDVGVSRQVLESLARVLRMSAGERAHLFTLAGLAAPAHGPAPAEVDHTLRRLLGTLDPNPAYVTNPWWDVLAHNAGYAALCGVLDETPPAERNVLWLMFTDERVRRTLADPTGEAARIIGQLRTHLARHPDDPRGTELVGALRAASPRFDELWRSDHSVREFEPSRKSFRLPGVGALDFDYVKLATADRGQALLVFLPADDTAAAKLRRVLRTRGEQPR